MVKIRYCNPDLELSVYYLLVVLVPEYISIACKNRSKSCEKLTSSRKLL